MSELTLTTLHDSGERGIGPNQGWQRQETVEVTTPDGSIHRRVLRVTLHIDASYPGQGRGDVALWTDGAGWVVVARRYGSELVVPHPRAAHLHEPKPYAALFDGMVEEALSTLGLGGLEWTGRN